MVSELRSDSAHITLYQDPYNKRMRVDDYSGEFAEIIKLIDRAVLPWVEKLIIKSRPEDVTVFQQNGYQQEAVVRKYFAGVDMHFVTRYFSDSRKSNPKDAEEEASINRLFSTVITKSKPVTEEVFHALLEDARDLAQLYKKTFPLYPTPLWDPIHIRKTMIEGTLYVFIRDGVDIVSAASAEVNRKYSNAELTDCATAEEAQGKGYMTKLLKTLELKLHSQNISCLYTIARAESFGMNKAFYQLGYRYGGRMTNNCIIYSGMEDMNVWYKG